jgi:hypothetical protein
VDQGSLLLAQLGQEHLGDLVLMLGVVHAAAALAGHGLQQMGIVVVADADCGDGEAAPEQLGGMMRQGRDVGDALIGKAIGEQDDVGRRARGHGFCHAFRSLQLAARDAGAAARFQPFGRGKGPSTASAQAHTVEMDPHLAVEADHGQGVVAAELADHYGGCDFGRLELATRHRATGVEHEGQVEL